jgi:uncharacterized protein (TIGR02598 family)
MQMHFPNADRAFAVCLGFIQKVALSKHVPCSATEKTCCRFIGPQASDSKRRSAFSLIEVTISLGIVAFAMVPIIGLVSAGMKSLRDSMDETVRAEIVRKVSGEALRVPYTNLSKEFQNKTNYFDDEGVQQSSSNASTIFVATTALAEPPSLITSDTSIARLLSVNVQHFADSKNKTIYSQLILNTAQ